MRDHHTGLTQKGTNQDIIIKDEKNEHKEKTVKAARGKITNMTSIP